MVNNFSLIRGLLRFDTSEDFYFLQIIKRRKDNPTMLKDMLIINYHCIYSYEELDGAKEKIIEQCTINNARAYININRRNSHRVAIRTLVKVSEMISHKNYRNVKGAYASACGENHSQGLKRWIIDIDTRDTSVLEEIYNYVNLVCAGKDVDVVPVPTKNGYHLIVPGFDLRQFKVDYPHLDIIKDGTTVLYIP